MVCGIEVSFNILVIALCTHLSTACFPITDSSDHPPGIGGSTSSAGSSGILFTHASRLLHVIIKVVSSYRLR